ncbi:MAG: hypothetical protein M1816_001310 [Peltula sp. TS41687]|nr:MAG: hypothetical protein M1816_001310 [Peltula sp. TS41687]
MQFFQLVLYILQLSFVWAQAKSFSSLSKSTTASGNNTKTLDFCRKSPDCLLVIDWLTFCNDTEIDPSSKADSDAFRVCICDPWSYFISNFRLCLRCFVDNFAQDENIIWQSQEQYYKFCTVQVDNASWFLDFNWIAAIAGVPKWYYWSRPANEPTSYPWNQTRKITVPTVGGRSTSEEDDGIITWAGVSRTTETLTRYSASRTTKTLTTYSTAAPSPSPTAPLTAPETTASAAAATDRNSAGQRVVVLGLWTSLLLWLGPLLILLGMVGSMVWL